MKITLFLTAATATVIHAGTPAPVVVESPPEVQWLVPTLDARLRYEFSDVEGFQNSNALTMRLRPGFKTSEWNGFSAFAEGEFTGAIIDDYNGGAPGVHPFDPAKSIVADPQNAELNRAFLKYHGYDIIKIRKYL